jgi:hypothetical protein
MLEGCVLQPRVLRYAAVRLDEKLTRSRQLEFGANAGLCLAPPLGQTPPPRLLASLEPLLLDEQRAMADELSLSSSASYANSWISWFLASKGNEYFCEVDDEYIIDRFNLTGLNQEVQGYSAAIELITDTAADQDLNDEQREQLEASARHLYGLIHARFIITSRGLAKMASPSRGFSTTPASDLI